MPLQKKRLNFWSIINMNVGFFGIQYSFGLQQTNMTPIYSYLGANPDQIPFLNLAGPMTGLIVQPIIGAMSDKTLSRFGRRRPYFMVGAIFCSICLLAMPFSSSLWMAAGLLWILDAANNITMEPYRAFVSDKLPPTQHATGFLSQSFFTGLGITLANLTPGLLVYFGLISQNARRSNNITYTTYAAFIIGAIVSIGAVLYSVLTTKEYPLSQAEIEEIQQQPKGVGYIFKDIVEAIKEMPLTMRQLGLVYLFNWYAMFIYWQFITLCLAKTIFNVTNPSTPGFSAAQLLTGTVNGTYNIVTFCVAFLIAWAAKKAGAKQIHAISLLLSGIGLVMLPFITNTAFLFLPMIGFGIGWASMMGTPYVILAGSIPPKRTGVYMGILNMFIVLPMLLETVSFSAVYHHLLGSDPVSAIRFAGVLIIVAAVLAMLIKKPSEPGFLGLDGLKG
ncbi:MFS transporter [Parasediminibacterium sp. JCM 36343]|uniref:MFS transporter n=1 Tax=Parasediminibacterium sp. JCM 36343 TaxID=3374279 RepID=UPI00397E5208